MKLSVKVTASAGEAAVCRALAKHFDVAPTRVSVTKGHTSRNKIIEII